MAPDSTTETYAALRLHIDSWRWAGVPFLIRAGKDLPVTATEVLATFHRPPQRLFDETLPRDSNHLRFRLGPDRVAIALGVRSKRPGEDMVGRNVELIRLRRRPRTDDRLRAAARRRHGRRPDPVRPRRRVAAAWRIVDDVLDSDSHDDARALPTGHVGSGRGGRPRRRRRRVARTGGWLVTCTSTSPPTQRSLPSWQPLR